MRRLGRFAAALAVLLLLTSCKVDVQVGIRVGENGSGTVRARFVLDQDAVEALGGSLDERLRVADLIQAGWQVDVQDRKGGGVEAVAEKRFAVPEEMSEAIDQLSGDIGPFREFALTRDRSAFTTDFTFEGTVDLEMGVGASALNPEDQGVSEEIEEQGVGVEELRGFLRERVDEAFGFEVVVDLPGSGSHNAPGQVAGAPRWTPRVGEVVVLAAESSETDIDRIVLVGLGGLLLLAAAALPIGWWFRRRRKGAPQAVG